MYTKLPFIDFSKVVEKQFNTIATDDNVLLVSMRIDKDKLWDTYLNAFPEEVNQIFRERREYDCNCCKNFIRKLGSVCYIKNNKLFSIWDNIKVDSYFQLVVDKLAEFVKSHNIENYFYTSESIAGSLQTSDSIDPSIKWNHFYSRVPQQYVKSNSDIGPHLSAMTANYGVLKRSMTELTLDSAETVLDLINQNSLYGGTQHKDQVKLFIKTKKQYDASENKELFLWTTAHLLKSSGRFKNTVIGTLLEDLSNNIDLDKAVGSFETKHAPQNYRRTSAVVTPKMIASAQEKIRTLGYNEALYRRHANVSDISIQDVLFTAVHEKPLTVFDELIGESKRSNSSKTFDKIETVDIKKFIEDILPTCSKVEVLFDHKYRSNLMALVAPQHATSNNILKWDNGISWSYKGDVADSIKERVKEAGGSIEGDLRVSLAWNNEDDLDLSCIEPCGHKMYFGSKNSRSGNGTLDVDANGGRVTNPTEPVENIIFKDKSKMKDGDYIFIVDQYNKRSNQRYGFELQVEYDGQIQTFAYDAAVKSSHKYVKELCITLKNGQFSLKKIDSSLKASSSTLIKENVWGITTNEYVPVSMIMKSPNHWNDQTNGNLHTFFILEGCNADEEIRGFYNEFLKPELNEHRKVFEVLGSKLKVSPTASSLSGLGFSETVRNEVVLRLTGKFQRTIKVQF